MCTSVGGVYSASTCQLLQQPVCSRAGGEWLPQKRASLAGGMDLLSVGLLQVSAIPADRMQKPLCLKTCICPCRLACMCARGPATLYCADFRQEGQYVICQQQHHHSRVELYLELLLHFVCFALLTRRYCIFWPYACLLTDCFFGGGMNCAATFAGHSELPIL